MIRHLAAYVLTILLLQPCIFHTGIFAPDVFGEPTETAEEAPGEATAEAADETTGEATAEAAGETTPSDAQAADPQTDEPEDAEEAPEAEA